jgi:hypothetical protein
MCDQKFLSIPISEGVEVTICKEEFVQICEVISADPKLVSELADYKLRWLSVNKGDDDLAFAELPSCMARIAEIMVLVTANPKVTVLSADVVLRHLGLRQA